MKDIKAVILVRVSTKKQETDRQRNELLNCAQSKGWKVIEVVEEKESGAAEEKDREGLERVRALVAKGKVNKVMVHEISRIARRNSVTHRFVEDMTKAGVSIYWHSQSQETLLENGKENALAGFLIAIFAEQAKNELATMKQRVTSGLEEARRRGVTLGRPKGKWDSSRFLAKHRAVVKLIQDNPTLTIGQIAKLGEVSENTVRKIKRILH